MATKSYKLRLDQRANQPIADDSRFKSRAEEVAATERWLDDTREAFNIGVDYLTGWLLKLHRGAGVWREKKDGIWRNWHEISTLDELQAARQHHKADPQSFALLENGTLLSKFGKSAADAVELAEHCRRLILHNSLLGSDREGAPMGRGALDELTPSRTSKRGKKVEGKRGRWARWQYDRAILAESGSSKSVGDLLQRLSKREEFAGDKKDAHKRLNEIKQRANKLSWHDLAEWIEATCGAWNEKKQKAADKRASWDELLAPLRNADILPIPGFERPTTKIGIKAKVSVWNYALWDMAGQRVRSHLGWVNRRTKERMIWELQSALFERGGWIRMQRKGKKIKRDELAPDDIRFDDPPDSELADYEHRPAYANRKWVAPLREYESVEMIAHLEGVALGAAEQPRILKRTAKGWSKVREKWIDLVEKAAKLSKPVPSASDLIEALNKLRARKSREYGDQRLFEWLAAPQRRWLWDGSNLGQDNDCGRNDRDCLSAFIAHNEHLADEPNSITFTRSDPVKHPVWPFFGENSAVEYWLSKETGSDGKSRLVLILKQLLCRQDDGSYSAIGNVRIALRGYHDFERSFDFPGHDAQVSAKQNLVFHDDLLGGSTRTGTLSGVKLTWERDELEASARKQKPRTTSPRIYANFSCSAGDAELPEWLKKHVGSDVKLKKPRDGMTQVFFLKKTVSKIAPDEENAAASPPGERKWPQEAIDNGFAIRGTDLGYRTSSAGAWWRLSADEPRGKVSWQVGMCGDKAVYAVLERDATVSLPGDGELLPPAEQALRESVYRLRARLGLNSALLRIARLLTLESVTRRVKAGDKTRKRSDGTVKRVGNLWRIESKDLPPDEVRANCRKAGEQLLNWATRDSMTESLKAILDAKCLWDWLAARNTQLKEIAEKLPKTIVPSEEKAKEENVDRNALKKQREDEDTRFAETVYTLRVPLAQALCGGYDAKKRKRGTSGLWAEFDAALLRELSYGDRKSRKGNREQYDQGLFRLLRKPPVTKHKDRKDDANNLPHGETYRGGISMARLNFLDDVKNFVRRWSCRPRWPGDLRRVPKDAKFDRCDTEHLDHLREHRAKLIAHSDVAQTLGFEQDLRRGLWRFRDDKTGSLLWHRPERGHLYQSRAERLVKVDDGGPDHPTPAYQLAHVLVYEDLTRYRMSSDRPKNENAGLARWSHRRIMSFAQHIGGLFGIPIAMVDARFSSRYCSRCGSPGCRADRFDPRWLDQTWLKRLLETAPTARYDREMVKVARRPHAELEKERPWVLRDGGEFFVCANPKCAAHTEPVNADVNAAANVGLRFLRGVDGIRASINANGKVVKSIGYVPPDTILVQKESVSSAALPYWTAQSGDGSSKRGRRPKRDPVETVTSVNDEDDDGGRGEILVFRDPIGGFRPADHWFEGKVFWSRVADECASAIKAGNASRSGSEDEED